MKIGLVSDLHSRDGSAMPEIPDGIDILLCAGDMGDPFLIRDKLKSLDIPFAYIAGNHEYYHYDFNNINLDVFNNTKGCYNNYTIEVNNKKIHLCTLWTDIPDNKGMSMYINGLNDSNYINNWTPQDYRREFNNSMKFLEDNVKEGDIVVTHHSVSPITIDKKYAGDSYNHCFLTNLDEFILRKKPSLWCCGHMHSPFDGYIGDTRIVLNPRGYKHEYEKREQYQVKIIDV